MPATYHSLGLLSLQVMAGGWWEPRLLPSSLLDSPSHNQVQISHRIASLLPLVPIPPYSCRRIYSQLVPMAVLASAMLAPCRRDLMAGRKQQMNYSRMPVCGTSKSSCFLYNGSVHTAAAA